MVYPYAFFKDSNGVDYIESENWSMRCHVSNTYVRSEFRRFIAGWPDREASVREEFADWLNMSISQRKALKRNWYKQKEDNMNCDTKASANHSHSISGFTTNITLGTLLCSPVGQRADWVIIDDVIKEEGKTPMCYNETANASATERDQRKFLLSSLYNARDKFYRDFHKHFHMEPVGPTTAKEMVEWIKADNFELKKDYDSFSPYDFLHTVKWVDKVNSPDEEGYAKAKDTLDKAYTDAERVIKIKSPEAGLDALVAFEAATFH